MSDSRNATKQPEAPHVPAAFINAIAEEGSKAEAVEWLQKTWNELCQAESRIRELERRIEERRYEDLEHEHFGCPVAKTGIYAPMDEATRKLAEKAVEAQRNDTRTMDEKISDGVVMWAKHGRDRGSIDEEEAECASMFGCGV